GKFLAGIYLSRTAYLLPIPGTHGTLSPAGRHCAHRSLPKGQYQAPGHVLPQAPGSLPEVDCPGIRAFRGRRQGRVPGCIHGAAREPGGQQARRKRGFPEGVPFRHRQKHYPETPGEAGQGRSRRGGSAAGVGIRRRSGPERTAVAGRAPVRPIDRTLQIHHPALLLRGPFHAGDRPANGLQERRRSQEPKGPLPENGPRNAFDHDQTV
ncbi:MAG: hypothetical protein AVDCRST_MAG56-5774, partial [uncultured Cytophagales bacterium]